jgi:hypothetical protein
MKMGIRHWLRAAVTVAAAAVIVTLARSDGQSTPSRDRLHFAVNLAGEFAKPATLGFNLADVSSVAALAALPPGMRGVFWLGGGYKKDGCGWQIDDRRLIEIVKATKDNPKFSGIYYVADSPHPSMCPEAPKKLIERTALIHELAPGAKTFVLVMDGSSYPNEFKLLKSSADYIGIDPYPCNVMNAESGCDWASLRGRITDALDAGISPDRIVPVFQAFGQACTNNKSQYYRLPSVEETQKLLRIWDELVPAEGRPFDMTYSWGKQDTHACPSLAMANGKDYPDLQSVYVRYFGMARE